MRLQDWQRSWRLLLQVSLLVALASGSPNRLTEAAEKARPNVLLMVVDDLRPELGCYGDAHVMSPNIDRLARSGRQFNRAYCQQAVCNPSRTSFLTGLRPDTIGVTGNHSHFRGKHPDTITLPQFFKQQGYHAQSIGKIYHGVFPEGSSKTTWDTMGDPESWSVPTTRFGPRYYFTEDGVRQAKQAYLDSYQPKDPQPDDWTKKLVFGPMTEAPEVEDGALYDGKVASAAVNVLRRMRKSDSRQPFFLAVGFIKPHTPFVAPKKYWDLYDPKEIKLATTTQLPIGAPPFAGHGSSEVRRYTDQRQQGDFTEANQRRLKHGYLACISYVDAQVGRILNELERLSLDENTIVVLLGDHGWHLGEHGLWGKTTNFELDTRVPFIVRAPDMKSPGATTESLAELVDLYPTLVELAGLRASDKLDGTSLVPILNAPSVSLKESAFSQYPRGRGRMGYSMRTDRWRVTKWVMQDSGATVATELYDHDSDPNETINVASEAKHSATLTRLSQRLETKFAIPKSDKPRVVSSPRTRVLSPKTAGFENVDPGPLTELKTGVGIWRAEPGHAEIDPEHRYRGKQCLHLLGGKERVIELELSDSARSVGMVSFQGERWTRRQPFAFRIEAFSDDQWHEIYNGDRELLVGTFRSSVRIAVDHADDVQKLRLVATSPAGSGVLIDEFQILPPTPQRIVATAADPITLPALVGVKSCPLARVRIDVEGTRQPLSLQRVTANLKGTTDLADVQSIQVFLTGSEDHVRASDDPDCFAKAEKFGETQPAAGDFVFSGSSELKPGANYLWISATLSPAANIDHFVAANCLSLSFSDGSTHPLQAQTRRQRMGVAVRSRGDDGVHTYRIPGLVETESGTLIAVYDVRRRSGGDLPGDIDVGMSRSVDGGRTWEPMRTIMDMGDDPKWRYDGIGDPAVLYAHTTGTIWVAATWSHGNRSWFGSGPGLEPEETGQLMLVRSEDDGVTWSKPINITKQVKKPEWCFLLQGPGNGITMCDGTLVFAAQYQDPEEQKRLPHSTIIYSRDSGQTWQVGSGAFDDTTEAQVAEIKPGVLMLNCRYNRQSARVVAMSGDYGKTWIEHPTSRRALIEPRACMGSLIKTSRGLLFSNPNSTRARESITIKGSLDLGMTWPQRHRLLLDEGLGAGYSCMTELQGQDKIGILYEGSLAQMTYQRIPISEILGDPEGDDPRRVSDDVSLAPALRLPPVFGDHMVLQANAPLPIWGTSSPASNVSVSLGDETKTTKADSNGKWRLTLDSRPPSSQPSELRVVSGDEIITLADVLVGEVWLCAGQSNMAWPLRLSQQGVQEIAGAKRPSLRLLRLAPAADGSSGSYTSEEVSQLTASTFSRGKWSLASADTASSFSAVGWYFARQLQEQMKVPVGIICPAVGGTPTEAWIPKSAMNQNEAVKEYVSGDWLLNPRLGEFCRERGNLNLLRAIQAGEPVTDKCGPNHAFKPGFMWQAGIEPIVPFAIRGAIWYQGESNAESPERVRDHEVLFPMMVNSWRDAWGQGDFPFLYVQLPAMGREHWPSFRDGQRRMLSDIPATGMAVTLDTGHPSNVHPHQKEPVGRRLARWALGETYGLPAFHPLTGPLLQSSEIADDTIVLHFDHVGDGLISRDGNPLRHFEVCGEDGKFYPATAVIRGKSILVKSDDVSQPVHARYAWTPFPSPAVNFFNQAGLPASPFTTEPR